MNKQQFLQELERLLYSLPSDEREEILADYNEYFANGLREGKSEEEIAEKLGSPQMIAKELGVNSSFERTPKKNSSFSSTVIAIALIFFNVVFIFGPAVGILGVLFGGWAASIGFIVAPLLQVIAVVIGLADYYLFEIFVSIACAGLGIFLLIGMYHLSKWVKKGFQAYYRWNMSVIKGGMNRA